MQTINPLFPALTLSRSRPISSIRPSAWIMDFTKHGSGFRFKTRSSCLTTSSFWRRGVTIIKDHRSDDQSGEHGCRARDAAFRSALASDRTGCPLWQLSDEFRQSSSGQPGRSLAAESAQQWEVGVKTELLDKKLTTTIAYYDLTKKNIAYADPTDPTGMRQLALGEARNEASSSTWPARSCQGGE